MSIKTGNKEVQKNKPKLKKQAIKVEKNSSNKWAWFALAVVCITTFIIYFKATGFGYVWDDDLYITRNSHIKDLKWENIKLFFTWFYFGNYQPISILMYAIEQKIFNGSSFVFHFTNIFIHIINTCLVYLLIRKISPKSVAVAIITAAFFAVHPMHVESVAWISGRKDVLFSFFFLLSLIMYKYYLGTQKMKYLITAFILFILSCMSKSAAVVLPLVMFLLDYYSNRKFKWKVIIEKLPFIAISLVFGIVAIYSQKGAGAVQDMAPDMSVIEHISVVSFSFISYVYKAFAPVHLSAIYPYPLELGSTLLPIIYYVSVFLVLFLLFSIWYSHRWGKDIIFGLVFFIVTIILVLQFIPVGTASMAERYTYIPYIGLFFIVGKLYEWLSMHVNPKFARIKNYLLIVLIIGFTAFSSITYSRVKIWENEETLFSDAINKYPYCNFPYFIRGTYYINHYANRVYVNNNNQKEIYTKMAIADFENALKFTLDPKRRADVYYSLGSAKGSLGNVEGAVKDFDKAIEVYPDHSNSYISRGKGFMDYFANELYANNTVKRKRYLVKAVSDFEDVIKLSSLPYEKAKAYYNLGIAKFNLGDYPGAIDNCDKAIEIDTNYADAYNNRGCAKFEVKKYREALEDYNKAIELNPRDANAVINRDRVVDILEQTEKE